MAGIAAKMITARNAAQCYLVQLATRMVEKMPIEKSQGAAMIPRARQPSIPRNDTSENKNDQKWQWEDSGTRALIRTLCIGVAIWTFGQNHADASAENKKVAKVVPATQLHGKWKKVEEVGQDKALLQMSLNWVFRSAATLLTNLDISVDDEAVKIVTQGGLVISITEKYGFDGKDCVCSRRDNRSGQHVGKIVESSRSKVVLRIAWSNPFGGEMYETFELREDGKLVQSTRIKVNQDATTGKPGEWYTYYSVYVKQ